MFTFGQLYNFFFHIRPVLGSSPRHMGNFLLRWIPLQRHVHTYYGVTLFDHPFLTPSSLPAHVHTGKFSLTSGVIVLSLYLGRAQLLPLALPSECLVRTKLRFYSTGQTPAVRIRGPSISYINLAKSNFRERRGGKKAWRSE